MLGTFKLQLFKQENQTSPQEIPASQSFFFLKVMPNPASSPERQMKVSPIEDVHYFHCNSQTAAQGLLPPPPKKRCPLKTRLQGHFSPKII